MVARLVEMVVKPGAAAGLSDAVENRAVPLAGRCVGFQGHLVMVLREERRIVVIASFWDSEEDAARFERETFPRVRSLMLPFIEGDVRARTFLITSETQTASRMLKKQPASQPLKKAKTA